jgi:hypothetical protein
MDRVTGSPEEDGRIWNLYTGPVPTSGAGSLRFKAWRVGFTASEEVSVEGRVAGCAPDSPEGDLHEANNLPL